MTECTFEVESLTLSRGGVSLFSGMNWRLDAGCVLAVTGPSGAGKSSLLACLGGLVTPDAGRFAVIGDGSAKTGFVFQNFRLTPNLTVFANTLCGSLGRHRWWQTWRSFPIDEQRRAFSILSELGLDHLAFRRVRKISGGEQQRTAIARLLVQNPQVILADEPTSNLDRVLARRVLGVLRAKAKEEKGIVIMVLHDASLVTEFADFELKIDAALPDGWRFARIQADATTEPEM